MARILLVTSPEKGHLNPMIGVAQWLLRLGHQVGWLCLPEPAPELASVGVEVVRLPDQHAASPHALVTSGEALARLVRDEVALRGWIRTLLLDNVPAQLEPTERAIAAFAPDAIGLDGMQYAAVIACSRLTIPYIGVSSALTLFEPPGLDHALIRTVRGLAKEREQLFRRNGLSPIFRTCEAVSPFGNTIFATRALVGDASLPPNTALVGPSIPPAPRGDETDFPWARLPADRPVVYASFGSQISWQPELFRLLAEATRPLGVTLVASIGELASGPFLAELPEHVVAVPYAPQLAVLERAAAFVTHGGANSVMEAMTAGVPLLVVPICNDQPVQAHFVTRAGVGLSSTPEQLTVDTARSAIAALLAPGGRFKATAGQVAASYRAHDGARAAADRIAQLA